MRLFVWLFKANFPTRGQTLLSRRREGVLPLPPRKRSCTVPFCGAVWRHPLGQPERRTRGGETDASSWNWPRVLLLPCHGGKEASGPAKVPGLPCLALGAGGSFVLARLERGVGPGSADTGAPGGGETRGQAGRAAALRHASSPPAGLAPVGDPVHLKGRPKSGEKGFHLF